MKKIYLLLSMALLTPFTSLADNQGVLDKVEEAYVFSKDHGTASFDYTNMVQISLASSPITLNGCSDTYLVFSLNPEVEPNGQAMYSTLLTAMAADRNIRFGITNDVAYAGHCAPLSGCHCNKINYLRRKSIS